MISQFIKKTQYHRFRLRYAGGMNMAFDGITVANITKELADTLTGGRIYKIAQPETDELLLTIKHPAGQRRLLISASASLPLIYLTDTNKPSPMTAPGFCMLLRKHLQNGRIVNVTQPGLERIIRIEIEHLNELGDLCRKYLITEIMGKHSNIIFCNEDNLIIDSIKHISGIVSSVREVLPGREYFIPMTQEKQDPLTVSKEQFSNILFSKGMPLFKALYTSFTGLSPIAAQEICYRAGIDGDMSAISLSLPERETLWQAFDIFLSAVRNGGFVPNIIYDNNTPVEFAAFPLTLYASKRSVSYSAISEVLEQYYAQKDTLTRIRQKSADLRKIVQTALERNVKKYDLQLAQMKDTAKREQYKVYGELITAYGYNVAPGSKSMEALNYYTNETIRIPLDETISPIDNAKKYFDKYAKLKRTYEALSTLTLETKAEITHLETIAASLDIALSEEDLVQIKEELIESGYIRRKGGGKKPKITSRPLHYISSDGFHMYVGKNNYQNEELTFQFANGGDWWFHAKNMPGSHVIVKTNGQPLPDAAFEEAARLAAYYSKGREQDKVEIDYTERKNVKKPAGGKPGFVVYYTNYSMMIDADISAIERLP